MTKFAVTLSICAVVATMMMSAAAAPEVAPASQTQAMQSGVAGVPADALPQSGECRIWYSELPTHAQPASMECEHAHWLARTWGGRVIQGNATGGQEIASYEGRNDFSGVPVAMLPTRGFCRAWLSGVDANAQPEESDCRVARQIAERSNGRVLYIPL